MADKDIQENIEIQMNKLDNFLKDVDDLKNKILVLDEHEKRLLKSQKDMDERFIKLEEKTKNEIRGVYQQQGRLFKNLTDRIRKVKNYADDILAEFTKEDNLVRKISELLREQLQNINLYFAFVNNPAKRARWQRALVRNFNRRYRMWKRVRKRLADAKEKIKLIEEETKDIEQETNDLIRQAAEIAGEKASNIEKETH